jgi:PAS domain S-box-containing protein/putative nucleotidyltransferase with HDIG domain
MKKNHLNNKTAELLIMEKKFRESEERLRSLLEHMSSAVAIYEAVNGGEDFVFKDFNAAAEKIEQISREQLVGKSVLEIFPAVKDFGIFEVFQRVYKTGKPEHHPVALYKDNRVKGWRDNYVYKLSSGEIVAIYDDVTERKQSEESLRLSEYKYRSIFENAVEGIFQTTPEGQYISVNPAFARMIGYDSPEEMINNITDIGRQGYVNPEERLRFKEILEKQGIIQGFETQHCRKDGSKIWVSINARAGKDEAGNVLYYEGTIEDITSRKQAAEQLRLERHRFSVLSENAPFGMTMIDKNGDFIYINPKFKEIFGYDLSDIPNGKAWFRKIYPDPEYRHAAISTWIKNLEEAGPGRPRTEIFTAVCKDGTRKIINFIPMQLETGEHIMHCEDITERTQITKSLHDSEEKYRALMDNAADAILIADMKGNFLEANKKAEELFGYTKKELLGMNIAQIHPEGELEKVMHVFGEIMEDRSHSCLDTRALRKDGETVPVDITGSVIEYGGQKIAQGIFRDITERKEAEEERKQTMEKLRRSLIGTIQAISLTVETKDPYTAGHQRRVSRLARVIAQEMGLANDTVDSIRMAGSIHDIGKMSVPAEILSKPGRLSDIEMNLIKVHSQSGYDILKDVGLPYPIAEIVLQHHERLNGSGYPQGLGGSQILLETQIVAIADVVEAIASNRPYRPAKGIDAALEEIEKNKGILYNAEAVDVCLRLFREKGFKFE